MEPLSKKHKTGASSSSKYDQVWKEEYSTIYKGISKSDKGSTFAFCHACRCNFNLFTLISGLYGFLWDCMVFFMGLYGFSYFGVGSSDYSNACFMVQE